MTGRASGRVLVVDDEPQIRRALAVNLKARGYDVDQAASGEEALHLAAARHPDVVLLDLGLPGIDGLEVIRGLRGWTSVPIVVLSVREAEADKVAALDLGADDYLTKPFGMNELLARLRAALRRHQPVAEEPVVETPDFRVDLVARRVWAHGEEVHLTPTEWSILDVLARHPGRLITQRQLLQQVWGPSYERETNYLRVYLAQLRRKLEPEPARPRYLITEPGMGYRFEPASPGPDPDDGDLPGQLDNTSSIQVCPMAGTPISTTASRPSAARRSTTSSPWSNPRSPAAGWPTSAAAPAS